MKRETFETIVKGLRPKILKVGRNFFGSDDDAEDVAQETLAVLWERCASLDEGRNVEALAMRVAKSCCVDMVRRKRLNVVRIDNVAMLQKSAVQPSPHEDEEGRERERAIAEAVEGLSRRERQLFKMRQEEGLSAEEIAQLTGIEKRSVLSIVSMVRKKVYNEIIRRINL
ncbi:MAG: sigma-70 family RNA polymerase sigma factor [Prevotellaceae bacterium]|nr:sigma-70 family RNA polymerase sigma factor [Prevotellaceae bacterium]